ncbi:acyltransferase family protein [Streptomyces sp. NA04227]|uniref:acyltransferase family protein n=1 Tax=Streptomyces sp. NA04227 TaxID=2742136 RepID=UPI00158FC077|nr:acyltransferase family protein [Streptomyces sp. NA04227]QKW06310.1 acyltransferase family protein [Streptomyces sp. NA04227]
MPHAGPDRVTMPSARENSAPARASPAAGPGTRDRPESPQPEASQPAPSQSEAPQSTAARTGEARTEEKRPDAGRDPFLDNAKYLTILCVGVGHFLEPLTYDSRLTQALYFVIYAFHMPAFILVSGHLSRGYTGTPRQVARLVTGIAVPYVTVQFCYTLFMRWAAEDPDREFAFNRPGFALWFLVALFLWRLTTPLWRNLRCPLTVSLGIAAAASVTPSMGEDFSLMRMLQYLPFFVLGLRLEPEHFGLLTRRPVRLAALPVFAAALLCAYWAVPRMDPGWFGRTKSAAEFGVPTWAGVVMFLAMSTAAVVLSACFLALVPRHRTWFTALGAGTLYAYLLHIFLVKSSREFDWYEPQWLREPASVVVVVLLASAVMTVLCTPVVRRLFRYVVEPRADWLFRSGGGRKA